MLTLIEESSPSTPTTGKVRLYAKSDGKMYFKDDTGTEYELARVGGGITLAGDPVAMNTATQNTWTGIPAGVRRVHLHLWGISTNGTSNLRVRIGDTNGVMTSGYLGAGVYAGGTNQADGVNGTAGIDLPLANAANVVYGNITFRFVDPNTHTWVWDGVMALSSSDYSVQVSGAAELTDPLDRVQLTTVNGTDAYDAGFANVSWEF